jgi:pimeloyl-ACP methyl ester carboxylesterase
MVEIAHRTIEANGLKIHFAEAGEGPLVLMCHGFPESWYSWRHQLQALAEAGFHAVAPDMRGYGQTDKPEEIERYTIFHLVGDMVALAAALSPAKAVIVGHDWGAPVAWHAALFRPDRFRGVIGLSVPFRPRGPTRPTSAMPQTVASVFYQLYFQKLGVAEAELDRNGGFLTRMIDPERLPSWLTEADIDFYAGEFARTGFRGGLNWYRNIDRNWELTVPFAGMPITIPALYVAGDRDLVVHFKGAAELIRNLGQFVPGPRRTIMLERCGHWTQQERAAEVNAAMIGFLKERG